jgi:hypothetical protein
MEHETGTQLCYESEKAGDHCMSEIYDAEQCAFAMLLQEGVVHITWECEQPE